jgi:anti-sigma-K factor RskA
MDREDDKELWDVLGRIPEPTLSPFFARNVVRKVRQETTPFERARSWFSLRRLVAASAVAAVVIGLAIATHHPVSQTPAVNDSDVVAKIDPQDYDVVADLDELIALDENSVWEDKPTL